MPATSRLHTFVRRAATLAALALLLGAIWLLRDGGRFLQHEDPLEHADAIFVLAGTRAERPLEGVDLYKAGWAPVVVLSPGRPEPAERMVRARGIRFPSEVSLIRDAMVQLGVPPSAILANDGYVDNTASEANLLRGLVMARHWHRVIIVTSKYHVRRAGFAFRRGLEGTGAQPLMRASHYDPSDPANWWRLRADTRYVVSEWEKLILYWLGVGA
ncbi:MAG TPA: YdcF family protein [Chthonomonadaceae bacterium]|nr:YdcF family protein [Chthonomonadaceae bacterium]